MESTASKLASMIKTEGKANVIFFVDDSPLLVGRTLDIRLSLQKI